MEISQTLDESGENPLGVIAVYSALLSFSVALYCFFAFGIGVAVLAGYAAFRAPLFAFQIGATNKLVSGVASFIGAVVWAAVVFKIGAMLTLSSSTMAVVAVFTFLVSVRGHLDALQWLRSN